MSLLICSTHAYTSCQLSDIAEGLCYLHSRNVVHGDLKGVRDYSEYRFTTVLISGQLNVLVDAAGHARIMGFCLATVTTDADPDQITRGQHGGSEWWSAPEVLEGGATSKKTDIFSFAMVIIEVRHG